MRTIRLIGMVLIAILMNVNFTACRNEDNSLKSKIIGEWGSYQRRAGNYDNTYWKDCGIISKITFFPDGHYVFESIDENTGNNNGGYSSNSYEFSEDETELYIDGVDVEKVLISTQALDERPFEDNLFIISGDFNRIKLWGWKFKRL